MEPETQIPKPPEVKKKISTTTLIIGILLFILSIGSSFVGGYYLQQLLTTNTEPTSSVLPGPTNKPNAVESLEPNSAYIKGKQYFDDTVIAVTTDEPRKVLIATATRQEAQNGANQSTRTSYFDGEKWTRKVITKNYETTAIYMNDIITQWNIDIDSSRVLKQSVRGTIQIDKNSIQFDTKTITNNIAVRSLPGYTKFMSTGDGSLAINGVQHEAKILYTRIYSNNSQEIQFYDAPFGLTTHWLAFWDNDGNFYHIDSTYVDKPTEKYQTHELGVVVDKDGRVSKTFAVKVNANANNPPNSYQIEFGAPINQTLNFTAQSSINKAPDNSYSWFMSNGVGQIGNTKGFGLVEYIHN